MINATFALHKKYTIQLHTNALQITDKKRSYRHAFWIFNPDAGSFGSPMFYNSDRYAAEYIATIGQNNTVKAYCFQSFSVFVK